MLQRTHHAGFRHAVTLEDALPRLELVGLQARVQLDERGDRRPEALRDVDHVVLRELRPAIDGNLAVAGIESDDHVPRKGHAQVRHEVRLLHGLGADDHVAHAGVEVGLDGFLAADAAADLDRQVRKGIGDAAHDLGVLRPAGEGAVEVDEVQAPGAGLQPAPRHRGRVVAEGGGSLHVALLEAHTLAVLEVDGRDQQHGAEGANGGGRGWASGLPAQEVPVQGQTVRGALLGVELRRKNVIPRHRRGKASAVVGLPRTVVPVRRLGVEAVHEVEPGAVGHPLPQRMVAALREMIRGFAATVIFGILIGTYSSIYVASPVALAMGVNTPASAVIIAGLDHPGSKGPEPYTVAEYKNITGRAGRLGYAEEGFSYVITLKPNEEHYVWTRYVQGKAEDLVSRFLANDTDPRSLIVSVLVAAQRSAAYGMNAEDIIAFLEGSFGAYQQTHLTQSWTWDRTQLTEALDSLQSHKLIEQESTGTYHLTPLGRLAGEGRVEVESIVRLVEAFANEQPGTINEATLVAATQLTMELDSLLFPINKIAKYKEPQAWTQALAQQQVIPSVMRALEWRVRDWQHATLRAKKAAACLYWMTDWPMAEIERTLTQFGGSLDGAAGPIRSVTARSCDLLPTVVRVAELLHLGLDLSDRLRRLITRLEVGVPGAAVDLAAHTGTRLSRGDYQRLLKAGLCAIDTIEKSEDAALLACLENNPTKLRAVRHAVELHREQENLQTLQVPTIPAYDR